MEQLLCHLFGDYFFQSDWMALNKDKRWWPCIVHVTLYTMPFLLLTRSLPALSLIFYTHLLIDRFSLAKYLIYAKNFLNPELNYVAWKDCCRTGYFDHVYADDEMRKKSRPVFITVWLYIISDNSLHLLCNYLALRYCT